MARNRLIYQSQLLYVSKDASSTAVADHEELTRVQSANYGFSITRQDINEYGQLARIDSLVVDPPTVNLDFSYYLTDGFNERALGFYVNTGLAGAAGGFASGHLNDGSGKNFYVTIAGEGEDGVEDSNVPNSTIGVGNAYLSDYSVDLSVGSLPTVTVSLEASNINSDIIVTGDAGGFHAASPGITTSDGTSLGFEAVLPSGVTAYADEAAGKISALRPGDVTIDISNTLGQVLSKVTTDTDGIHVQSASLSVPLSRTAISKLGTKFDYAKVVDFPVTVTLNVSAIVNEMSENDLVTIIDQSQVDVSLLVKNDAGVPAVRYDLKKCDIDSESFSSSIGSDNSVDMTFTTQIGSATDLVNGVFMSGMNTGVVFA
mgnify:FL=1